MTNNYYYDLRIWDFNHENHGFWNKRTVLRGWGIDPTDDYRFEGMVDWKVKSTDIILENRLSLKKYICPE